MGAGAFNGRVRDGIGFGARRLGHQTGASQRPGRSVRGPGVRQAVLVCRVADRRRLAAAADQDVGMDHERRSSLSGD